MITVLALCQIPIAAIRLALAGWEPSVDSGATTVRIRDVLSTRPPMTGMAAFPSMNEAQNYSFPGALHLYLLALPVRLLGTTWGVLVGMAIINTAASAAAIWLIRRRLGERWAILTAVFLASLLWTLGTGPLVFPTPMAIVVVPLFAFLVAAWATAEGDEAGLLVFVMLANYLFLSQLVLVVVVPVVAAVALARFVAVRVAERRRSATDSADRRRRRKWIVASAAFTVLVWIPPIIDQFTGAGNLGKVFNSLTSGHVRIDFYANLKPSFRGAVGVLTSVVAVPHWWLPPSFVHAPFDRRGGGTSFVVGAAWTVVVVALGLWGYLRARRRGDRTIVSMLAIAVSVWLAYLVTAWKDPDVLGYSQQYLMGLWPTSAFIWLAVTTAVASAVPDVRKRLRDLGLIAPRLAAAAICAIVAVAIAAPQRSPDILTPSESLANAR
ncbi:MAG: hypothetical protein JST73_05195, partial [Actinobacteria bacterium]|nr:hypothetical protein [Actinomycetota bacterium]